MSTDITNHEQPFNVELSLSMRIHRAVGSRTVYCDFNIPLHESMLQGLIAGIYMTARDPLRHCDRLIIRDHLLNDVATIKRTELDALESEN